jgi:hypothetical protein
MIISKKLRESAKGQECTMQVAGVCNGNPETSVLAHIQVDGGIMGGKTDDISACISCSSCHEWLDQHRGSELDELFYTRRAMIRTHLFWIEKGLLVVR